MKIKVVLAGIVLMAVCAQIVCATDVLSVEVNCQGHSREGIIPNGYKFYADEGESITLTAIIDGGAGNEEYLWTKSGTAVCKRGSFQLIVAENVKYILTVTDSGGSVNKTIEIVSISSQKPKCLPDFIGGITIRDERGRTEYSAGDIFTVEVRIDTRYCPDSDYELCWTADDENIIFVSPSSAKTEVIIGQGISVGGVEIEVTMTNGKVVRRPEDGGIEIEIVKNIPPQFGVEHSEPPIYSGEYFEVWASDFEPSDGDYSYSATLTNERDEIVSADRAIGRNGEIPHLRLRPNWFQGVYRIDMTVENSHGLSTTATGYVGNIFRGKNDRNAPIARAPDIIYCVVGEVCVIDASETADRDKYVSNFGFYVVGGGKVKEQLANPEGHFCSGPICKHSFTYPGIREVEIEAKYFDGDDRRESEVGTKVVRVVVKSVEPVIITTPTIVITPMPAPTAIPKLVEQIYIETNIIEEPEIEKRGIRKFLSDIINAIKNALNL